LPTSGLTGTVVNATGTGFAADSAITITFSGKTVTTTCTSNATGSFSCTFKVPAAPHGPQTVVAKDASDNNASATFSVKAKLLLSPTSGPGRTVVTVTGTGFSASSAIKITFNGTKVAICKSNAVGSFSCTFDVPVGKNSSDAVKAKDASGDTASTTFTRN
jgi:IPT/TIG domain